MKIEIGHRMYGKVTKVEGSLVRFYAEDGRCMFEVSAGDDGRSLEIRGVEVCKVKGVLYDSTLLIKPNVANVITVETNPYPPTPPEQQS